jgi:AraC-like DNA-binding protein
MKNWKVNSLNATVSSLVECYWFLQKEPTDVSVRYPKLNPDPVAHLILAAKDQPYRYFLDDLSLAGKGSHWIFPHNKTFVLDHSDPFEVIGVKFKIEALYSLGIGDPQSNQNTIVAVNPGTLIPSYSVDVSALLSNTASNSDRVCSRLDEWLQPWIKLRVEDRHTELVHRVLPLILIEETPISKIGDLLFCSQRTVERSFLRVTGLTLKQYQSMVRLEAVLEHLYGLEDTDIDWTDIAYQFNFSDQAHLIRSLKNAVGATPSSYTRERNITIDVYGNFE